MNHPELKSICITAKSGTVLFSSELSGVSRTQHSVGALITALVDLSTRSIGVPVSYICMNNIAITIAQSEDVGIKVVLFHDAAFYRELARCIANSILHVFCERFDPSDFKSTDTTNFRRFNNSLGPSIRDCAGYMIHSLVDRLRGAAQYAVVFNEGDPKFAYPSNADSITVAANLQQLQFAIQEVSNLTNDTPFELVVENEQLFTHIALIGTTIVILQVRAAMHSPEVLAEVKRTLEMVRLCAQTADCLMG
ncbi:hypothetical protein TRFO_38453 [Tritrichomonas foetus]|uniref:FUZ/MON1/HPS1 first Longin domain-containing protein n=1 Tax=Tritrichomonas foetus TaxID=1144522 RepID=A0A1J4JDY6_9EUKA|nr:hypothetical protein TRFO_38453 [Tritrichomonas foetus]|eukprot:OHS95468.1 hypothetical protein TRFO_38453 [Tritrichomonas foetus]